MFEEIPGYKNWDTVQEVQAGWSKDRKFYVRDQNDDEWLLRLADIDVYHKKVSEFLRLQKFNSLHIPIPRAIDFGVCNAGKSVYMVLSWMRGVPLAKALTELSAKAQYRLGVRAGQVLRAMHALPVEMQDIPKGNRLAYKHGKLWEYQNSSVRVPDDYEIVVFVRKNLYKLKNLPMVYQHGDYHVGNMLYTPEGKLAIIDFNRGGCGDVADEFVRVQSFDVEISVPFSVGQVQGYFDGDPPLAFWDTLAVHVAHTSLTAINWAERFGKNEIAGMQMRCLRAMKDYDYFRETIPRWYRRMNVCNWRF